MKASSPILSASEAAIRLGVSHKALRIYEQRGLVIPNRTRAGYRAYTQEQLARAAEVVALRRLGLSLGQVARALEDDAQSLEQALAMHEAALETELRRLADTVNRVRRIRAGLLQGEAPVVSELYSLLNPPAETAVAFDLPWPWAGERFALREIKPITYITGPLGSGKTRFAQRLSQALPNAAYVGLDRLDNGGAAAAAQLASSPALQARVALATSWLVDEGATESAALAALLTKLEAEGPSTLVVDMVEQELDQPTQEALITHLRRKASQPDARPLFLMTRSSAMLDLLAMGPDEAVLFCPANHSPPLRVAPYPDAPGFEAVAMCLASPDVRARTAGVTAVRASATPASY